MYVCRNITFFVLRLTNADFVPHDCMNFLSFNCIRIYNTPYTRYVYSCYSSIQYLNLHLFLRMKGYEIFFFSVLFMLQVGVHFVQKRIHSPPCILH